MNSICEDIKFTTESQLDYYNRYIPALDFKIKFNCLTNDNRINENRKFLLGGALWCFLELGGAF